MPPAAVALATCRIELNVDARIKASSFAGIKLDDPAPEWGCWGAGLLVDGKAFHPKRSSHCILTSANVIRDWREAVHGATASFYPPDGPAVTVRLQKGCVDSLGCGRHYSFTMHEVLEEDLPKLQAIPPAQLAACGPVPTARPVFCCEPVGEAVEVREWRLEGEDKWKLIYDRRYEREYTALNGSPVADAAGRVLGIHFQGPVREEDDPETGLLGPIRWDYNMVSKLDFFFEHLCPYVPDPEILAAVLKQQEDNKPPPPPPYEETPEGRACTPYNGFVQMIQLEWEQSHPEGELPPSGSFFTHAAPRWSDSWMNCKSSCFDPTRTDAQMLQFDPKKHLVRAGQPRAHLAAGAAPAQDERAGCRAVDREC